MQDTTLEPWQIEHIRKMKQDLGLLPAAADAEEVTMNKDLGALSTAVDPDVDLEAETVNDAAAGALSAYKTPNVQKAQSAYDALAKEQMDRYNGLQKALEEKRYGPSFSERMFQLSAALAQPTSRRGFGGILENITPVLAAQQKAQREGQINRQEALEQLEANRLAQQMGLAKQGLTTALDMAKLEAMANKMPPMKSVVVDAGKSFDPISGEQMVQPNEAAYADLASDPSQANYDDFIQEFGPRFAEKAMRIVNYARRGK